MKYRKLVGYIPSPLKTASFAYPVYKNIMGEYEFHKIDEELQFITGFDAIPEEPLHMVELPDFLERVNVEEGDSPFFIITMNSLLFVGTSIEIKPLLEGFKKIGGESFVKELDLIPLK